MLISIACAIIVLVIVLFTNIGNEFRPTPDATRAAPVGHRLPGRGVVVALAAAAFLFAQTCQKDQIRITKEQAIATAERQVDFDPTRTQIRLLRQGLNAQPFWIVSLSVPAEQAHEFRRTRRRPHRRQHRQGVGVERGRRVR